LINGLILQKETIPKIKRNLNNQIYNTLYIERKQANYLFFFKKLKDTHLNVQIRNVMRTISEEVLYGKES